MWYLFSPLSAVWRSTGSLQSYSVLAPLLQTAEAADCRMRKASEVASPVTLRGRCRHFTTLFISFKSVMGEGLTLSVCVVTVSSFFQEKLGHTVWCCCSMLLIQNRSLIILPPGLQWRGLTRWVIQFPENSTFIIGTSLTASCQWFVMPPMFRQRQGSCKVVSQG